VHPREELHAGVWLTRVGAPAALACVADGVDRFVTGDQFFDDAGAERLARGRGGSSTPCLWLLLRSARARAIGTGSGATEDMADLAAGPFRSCAASSPFLRRFGHARPSPVRQQALALQQAHCPGPPL
jgi:hypothetical protein